MCAAPEPSPPSPAPRNTRHVNAAGAMTARKPLMSSVAKTRRNARGPNRYSKYSAARQAGPPSPGAQQNPPPARITSRKVRVLPLCESCAHPERMESQPIAPGCSDRCANAFEQRAPAPGSPRGPPAHTLLPAHRSSESTSALQGPQNMVRIRSSYRMPAERCDRAAFMARESLLVK